MDLRRIEIPGHNSKENGANKRVRQFMVSWIYEWLNTSHDFKGTVRLDVCDNLWFHGFLR